MYVETSIKLGKLRLLNFIIILVIMLKFLIVLSIFHALSLQVNLIYPISFTVVRNIKQPLSIQLFLNRTGCCQFNPTNNIPTSYNIVSLDGFSSTSTSNSFQNNASPLSIWANAFYSITGGKDSIAGNTTSSVQQHILKIYRSASSKLLFNALSDSAPISAANVSANSVAQKILDVLAALQLDGVSIQFSDYHAVSKGTASVWLNTLLSTLRSAMGNKTIVLIIPPTFVLNIPLLQQPKINSYVDIFVLKYYDTNQADYNTYQSLFVQSSKYPRSAFMELINNQQVWIDTCKTIIAKPTTSNLERTSGGFIDSNTLRTAFNQMNTNANWFGGFANLDFQGDSTLDFQSTVLQDIRNTCFSSGKCICN